MKFQMKRALSLLLALAVVCSFAVLPASAADLSFTVKTGLSEDGKSYTADVYITGSGSFGVRSVGGELTYNNDVLEFVRIEVLNPKDGTFGLLTNADRGTDPAGSLTFGGASSADISSDGGEIPLFSLVLRVRDSVVGQKSANISVFADEVMSEADGELHVTPFNKDITFQGKAPAIESVTVTPSTVEVDGKNPGTAQAAAEFAEGASDKVKWSVSSSDGDVEDVKINETTGAITVAPKAVVKDYTITATNSDSSSSKSATLHVTRAEPVATEVKVTIHDDDNHREVNYLQAGVNYTITAQVYDQFGDVITAGASDLSWEIDVKDSDNVHVVRSGNSFNIRIDRIESGASLSDLISMRPVYSGSGSDSVYVPESFTPSVTKDKIKAWAVPVNGDYGNAVYISITEVERANSLNDLDLDQIPTRVSVTYADGETGPSSFYFPWDRDALWGEFVRVRNLWYDSEYVERYGVYPIDPLDCMLTSEVGNDDVEVLGLGEWLTIYVEEDGANAGGWIEDSGYQYQYVAPAPSAGFTDVADDYWAAEDINWCYAKGIMNGRSEGVFDPSGITNRQQLWMVLARINRSAPESMAMARNWSVNMGISDGTNATGSLTRQQMVSMLYRYASFKGYSGVNTTGSLQGFKDTGSVSDYAADAMAWAVANGIIGGNDGYLMPNGTATRAQFAAIIHRFCTTFNAN